MKQTFEDQQDVFDFDMDGILKHLNIIQLFAADKELGYKVGDLLCEIHLTQDDLDDFYAAGGAKGSVEEEKFLAKINLAKKKLHDLGRSLDE